MNQIKTATWLRTIGGLLLFLPFGAQGKLSAESSVVTVTYSDIFGRVFASAAGCRVDLGAPPGDIYFLVPASVIYTTVGSLAIKAPGGYMTTDLKLLFWDHAENVALLRSKQSSNMPDAVPIGELGENPKQIEYVLQASGGHNLIARPSSIILRRGLFSLSFPESSLPGPFAAFTKQKEVIGLGTGLIPVFNPITRELKNIILAASTVEGIQPEDVGFGRRRTVYGIGSYAAGKQDDDVFFEKTPPTRAMLSLSDEVVAYEKAIADLKRDLKMPERQKVFNIAQIEVQLERLLPTRFSGWRFEAVFRASPEQRLPRGREALYKIPHDAFDLDVLTYYVAVRNGMEGEDAAAEGLSEWLSGLPANADLPGVTRKSAEAYFSNVLLQFGPTSRLGSIKAIRLELRRVFQEKKWHTNNLSVLSEQYDKFTK